MAVGPEIPMKKMVGPCQCTVSEFPFAMKIWGVVPCWVAVLLANYLLELEHPSDMLHLTTNKNIQIIYCSVMLNLYVHHRTSI